jgi:predicted membrane protein
VGGPVFLPIIRIVPPPPAFGILLAITVILVHHQFLLMPVSFSGSLTFRGGTVFLVLYLGTRREKLAAIKTMLLMLHGISLKSLISGKIPHLPLNNNVKNPVFEKNW